MQQGYSDHEYRRAQRRHRRRRRRTARIMFLLLIVVGGLVAYKSGVDFSNLRLPTKASSKNIERSFETDLNALSAQYSGEGGFAPSGSDMDALRSTAKRNGSYREKIEFFIKHIGWYDQTAVNTVLISPEKIDFVLMCPFAENTPTRDWGISVKKGEVPYFIQYDSRWAFHSYGSSCMGNTGCGPTCLAMAAAGLTGNGSYTPDAVADYAYNAGYYVPGSGTSWELFTSGAKHFGVEGRQISAGKSEMESCLASGDVLIASLLPGDFTMAGHFIVIYGTQLGGFRVYDPSSVARSGVVWSFARLEPQIAQLWSLSAD